jgi:hypothetical protein
MGHTVQIAYVDVGYTVEKAEEAAGGKGIRLEVVKLPKTLAGLHFVAFSMLMAARFVQLGLILNPPSCGCS